MNAKEPQLPLSAAGFADEAAAAHCLQRLGQDPQVRRVLAAGLPELLPALANTASADRALLNLERLVAGAHDPAGFLDSLLAEPGLLETLTVLFAGSQFLSDIVLRHPAYLELLRNRRSLAQPKSPGQFAAEALELMAFTPDSDLLPALRRWQRREFLRIGACDLLGLLDLPTVTRQLSRLADALVEACLEVAATQAGVRPEGLAVFALGKLGGEELNYSSDIDLLFLARADGDRYLRLGEKLIDALARVMPEGFLYRVDMRLRPWGSGGALVPTLDGHLTYLERHARLWERQALLKARVIAGDRAVGAEFLRRAEPFIYGAADEVVRTEVREMKARIELHLSQHGHAWGEVKLGRGSIRDVEFVVQYLQLVHGGRHPELRSANTLEALARLWAGGFLSADEYRVLADGYTFLRPIEHYLQMMHHQQTHALPTDAQEMAYLARRLGFGGADAGARLVGRYEENSEAIRTVYQRYLEGGDVNMSNNPRAPSVDVRRHVERMAPSYAQAFSEAEIKRHAELVERLSSDNLVEVEVVPLADGSWRVTIVGYDYTGELSLICGLLFVYGFTIRDGHVFTYEPLTEAAVGAERREARRKIVDVFNVRSVLGAVPADTWTRYEQDLAAFVGRLRDKEQAAAQGELAKRVAVTLPEIVPSATTLHPIDIEIDNEESDRYTVLRIDAPDTIGFLYEFTNALALSDIHIARVNVASEGNRVRDTLYLTDARGNRITDPEKQRELRVATVLVKHFTHLLPQSPNAESALLHFREFLERLLERPNWPDELASLDRPQVLRALARLLGVSDFLWDDFLRMQYANLFPVVRDVDALLQARPQPALRAELAQTLAAAPDGAARRAALNAFKDREMFRIDMRHIEGHSQGFRQFSAELTDLAEVVVEAAFRLVEGELRARYGAPCLEDGRPCPMSVCALGKCGGRELGFASDIELMFVYAGSGETAGPARISCAEFYDKLVLEVTNAIRARREGIFEIDLQLRPHGQAGSLAVSLDSFRRYFAPGGAAWDYERQALIKLRPIAGDAGLGAQVMALRDKFVYEELGPLFDVAALHAMRERQLRRLVTGGTINAKFSRGGLVDVEYLVQVLQLRHGRTTPALRLTNTSEAISALAAAGALSAPDAAALHEAYTFLRTLIDALRMVRGNARDLTVPPAESEDFAFLARRLGYGQDLPRLRADIERYMTEVQALSARLLS